MGIFGKSKNYREASITFYDMMNMRSEEVGDYLMSQGFDLAQHIEQTISHTSAVYIFKQHKKDKKL